MLWVGIKCFQPIFIVFLTVSDRREVGDIHVENEDVSLSCYLYTPYLQSDWSIILVFSNTFLAFDWSVILVTLSWFLIGQLFLAYDIIFVFETCLNLFYTEMDVSKCVCNDV